jgi:hypothetical protein
MPNREIIAVLRFINNIIMPPVGRKKEFLNVKSESTQISHLDQESYRLICCDLECCISQVSIIFMYERAPQRLY